MTDSQRRDDLLDAVALIAAMARCDSEAGNAMLDLCDQRAVIKVLARWCACYIRDQYFPPGAIDIEPWLEGMRHDINQEHG